MRVFLRSTFAAAILVAGVAGFGAGTAWAWSDGLNSVLTTTSATSTSCDSGSMVWTVHLNEVVNNIEVGDPAYVTAVTYTTDPSATVTVVSDGGMASGTTVPAGNSTTTYKPVVQVSLPCSTASATISLDITANWGSADPGNTYNYNEGPDPFISGGSGLPAIGIGGTAAGVALIGVLFTVRQRRRRTGTTPTPVR